MIYIKQYGLQRSGTNAIKALIEVNFARTHVLSNYLGNKHESASWEFMRENCRVQDPAEFALDESSAKLIRQEIESGCLKFVINLKDPISWVNSYYKYQNKKFVYRNPGKTLNFSLEFCDRALESWTEKVSSWIEFYLRNESSCIIIQHEQLLRDPSKKLLEIEQKFCLERINVDFTCFLEGYARRGTDKQHGMELINSRMKFDRDYHLEGQWKHEVPAHVMEYALKFALEFFKHRKEFKRFFDFEHFNKSDLAFFD